METDTDINVNGTEEKTVKRDLAKLLDMTDLLDDLEGTPVQNIMVILEEWRSIDNQRAQASYKLKVSKAAGNKDEIKAFAEQHTKVMERLNIVTRDLIQALAQDDAKKIRERPENWTGWPMNLRPILKKHLKKVGVDVSDTIAKAEALEAVGAA